MPFKDPEKAKEYYRQRYKDNINETKEQYSKYREAHKEERREYDRKRYEANSEIIKNQVRNWRRDNPKKVQERSCRWRKDNPDKSKECSNKYRNNNPARGRVHCSNRRARKLQAIPIWANKNLILEMYKRAKKLGLVVDHIVPLTSKVVCGLHWEGNLQLLTSLENGQKGNKLIE